MADLLPAYPLPHRLAAGARIGPLAGLLDAGGDVVPVPAPIEIFDLYGRCCGLAGGAAQTNILIASLTAASARWWPVAGRGGAGELADRPVRRVPPWLLP